MAQLESKARTIYKNANEEIKQAFPGFEFSEAETLLPDLKLCSKPSWKDKQKENRKAMQKLKKSVETQQEETAVLRTFGSDISLQKRNQIRMVGCFETPAKCQARVAKVKENIIAGEKSAKDHVGKNILPWNQEGCFQRVRSYPDGYNINFTELARQYDVKNTSGEIPKNGGQIVKTALERNDFDLNRFTYLHKGEGERLRRRKRKIEGTSVSMSCDITNAKVRENLALKITDGTYTVGEMIVLQKFQKLIINGKSTEFKEFEIAGRKVPLIDLRRKQYNNKKMFTGFSSKLKLMKWTEGKL